MTARVSSRRAPQPGIAAVNLCVSLNVPDVVVEEGEGDDPGADNFWRLAPLSAQGPGEVQDLRDDPWIP